MYLYWGYGIWIEAKYNINASIEKTEQQELDIDDNEYRQNRIDKYCNVKQNSGSK